MEGGTNRPRGSHGARGLLLHRAAGPCWAGSPPSLAGPPVNTGMCAGDFGCLIMFTYTNIIPPPLPVEVHSSMPFSPFPLLPAHPPSGSGMFCPHQGPLSRPLPSPRAAAPEWSRHRSSLALPRPGRTPAPACSPLHIRAGGHTPTESHVARGQPIPQRLWPHPGHSSSSLI